MTAVRSRQTDAIPLLVRDGHQDDLTARCSAGQPDERPRMAVSGGLVPPGGNCRRRGGNKQRTIRTTMVVRVDRLVCFECRCAPRSDGEISLSRSRHASTALIRTVSSPALHWSINALAGRMLTTTAVPCDNNDGCPCRRALAAAMDSSARSASPVTSTTATPPLMTHHAETEAKRVEHRLQDAVVGRKAATHWLTPRLQAARDPHWSPRTHCSRRRRCPCPCQDHRKPPYRQDVNCARGRVPATVEGAGGEVDAVRHGVQSREATTVANRGIHALISPGITGVPASNSQSAPEQSVWMSTTAVQAELVVAHNKHASMRLRRRSNSSRLDPGCGRRAGRKALVLPYSSANRCPALKSGSVGKLYTLAVPDDLLANALPLHPVHLGLLVVEEVQGASNSAGWSLTCRHNPSTDQFIPES